MEEEVNLAARAKLQEDTLRAWWTARLAESDDDLLTRILGRQVTLGDASLWDFVQDAPDEDLILLRHYGRTGNLMVHPPASVK